MLDINKMMEQEDAGPAVRGYLIDLEPWTEGQAVEMARPSRWRDGTDWN